MMAPMNSNGPRAPGKSAGFSLIEIMVALAVLAGVSYFISSLLNNSLNTQRGITMGEDARSLTYDMASILTNPDACKNTFLGLNPSSPPSPATGLNLTAIKKVSGAVAYTVGEIYGNRTVKLTGIRLGGSGVDVKTALERNVDTSTDHKSGIALVLVEWEKVGEKAGVSSVNRWFKIAYTLTAPGGTIESCFSLGGVEAGLWKRSISDPAKIFYSEGNVGVGTDTPAGTLSVHKPGDQGTIIISGDGDGDETYSSLNLMDKDALMDSSTAVSWSLVHKKRVSAPEAHSFQIAHWKAGVMSTPFMISKDDKVGVGFTLDPHHTLDVVTPPTMGGGKNAMTVRNASASGYSSIQFRDHGDSPVAAVGWNNSIAEAYFYTVDTDKQIVFGGGNSGPVLKYLTIVGPSGDVYAKGTVFADNSGPSDARLKKDIAPLDGYSLAQRLAGVAFTWKETGRRELGFIAQEVEKVAPELVLTMKNGFKALRYANITAILVEAFKTLDEKVRGLFRETESLRAENAALARKVEELSRRLNALEARINAQ